MAEKTTVAVQTQAELVVNNKFIDSLATQLEKKKEDGLILPPDYAVSNALNSAYLMLQETKDRSGNCVLQSCKQQSVATALMDMAIQGLNPVKKQCYFVAYGDKLTLMRSYQGTMAVAKRVGAKKIVSQVIYEGDTFEYAIEDGVKVIKKHSQDFKNIDNTKITGAYAIVKMENFDYVEVMNISQIQKAWSKGYGYKPGSGVHAEFTDQMAMKTVINRACKNIINSSDDSYLTESEERTEDYSDIDVVGETAKSEIKSNANTEDFEECETVENPVVVAVGKDGQAELVTDNKAPY